MWVEVFRSESTCLTDYAYEETNHANQMVESLMLSLHLQMSTEISSHR